MAHTYRKHQEGHQHGIRIQPHAHEFQQPHLPHHGDRGAQQRRRGQPAAAGIQKQHDGRDGKRDQEKKPHQGGAFDQVADELGKAGNADTDIIGLILVAHHFLEVTRELCVIQPLPGVRVDFNQWRNDDSGLEIVGDDTPDLPGLEHVLTQFGQRALAAVIIVRYYRAANKALLCHLHPARIRRP